MQNADLHMAASNKTMAIQEYYVKYNCVASLNFAGKFYIFKSKHKSNTEGARFEFYKKELLTLGADVEKCSGSKLSDLQLY